MNSEAFTKISVSNEASSVVLLCEHASNHIPPPLVASKQDQNWLNTHWALDIGVTDIIQTLTQNLGCPAVLANFCRLVCDANRPLDEPTYIRRALEGKELTFNHPLESHEIQRRTETYYLPYHQAVDTMIKERMVLDRNFFILSLHSFTPDYMGEKRKLEIGVLYDDYAQEAAFFHQAFEQHGFNVQYNEPWSGVDGMIFSPHKHGTKHQLINLELEFRQDLIDTPKKAAKMGNTLSDIIARFSKQHFL
jgi:predicted N-formylglutamate amidohydrolase